MGELERSRMIARQSQMERAIEYYTLINVKPNVLELLATADHFAKYIESGLTKEVITTSKRVDEFIDKKKTM